MPLLDPSTHPSLDPSPRPLLAPPIAQSVAPSIARSTHLSIRRPVHRSLHLSLDPSPSPLFRSPSPLFRSWIRSRPVLARSAHRSIRCPVHCSAHGFVLSSSSNSIDPFVRYRSSASNAGGSRSNEKRFMIRSHAGKLDLVGTLLVGGPGKGGYPACPLLPAPAAGRILIPRRITAAAGERRNYQTTAEGPGMNHIVGVFQTCSEHRKISSLSLMVMDFAAAEGRRIRWQRWKDATTTRQPCACSAISGAARSNQRREGERWIGWMRWE